MMPQKILTAPPEKITPAVFPRRTSFKVAHNLQVSFKYAWAGLSYAFTTQRNFRIHLAIGTIALALSIGLQLQPAEMAVITLTIGMVLAMELLNTALEAVVDLAIGSTYHELAKIAKDCAAGAVLVTAIVAILNAGVLIFPALVYRLQNSFFFS
jgi:diacylglycerol kinase (ATP)